MIQKVDDDIIIFDPEICEACISHHELSKILYENKKIFIRQKDDIEEEKVVENEANKDDCEIINSVRLILN